MEDEYVSVVLPRDEAKRYLLLSSNFGERKSLEYLLDIQRKVQLYTKHIEDSFIKADSKQSKNCDGIFSIYGHSGVKTRCFYNNMGELPNMRYLEIGVLHGSSTCSMLYKNSIDCLAIDNFSEFEGSFNDFKANIEKYSGDNNINFICQDCWSVDARTLGKFNVYLFDGPHEEEDHYRALHNYNACLDDVFIYIVDDWNWTQVRSGTHNAIKNNNLRIAFKKEIKTTTDNTQPEWDEFVWPRAGPTSDWHNGICVFVLIKNEVL